MKKKRDQSQNVKLSLASESLRRLDDMQLSQAAGAGWSERSDWLCGTCCDSHYTMCHQYTCP